MKGSISMSFRGKKISQLIKMSLALVGVLGTTMLSDVSTAYAEKIIHTHIWATKYDNTKHWEYCTVCGETQESKEHKYTDNWEFGYESCHKSNGNNFNTKICKCGHSYVVRKDHVEEATWYNTGVRMVHYKRCSVCKDWTRSGNCSNSKGKLGCTNPGKCDTCGYEATKDYHVEIVERKFLKLQIIRWNMIKIIKLLLLRLHLNLLIKQ